MGSSETPNGPLSGLRVVEFAGLAPAPFAAMLLADLGATVVRIDRARKGADGLQAEPPATITNILARGRKSFALDLKHPKGRALALALIQRADVLIEGFRPGVMERIGLGPEVCCAANPGLVYGRMTGWGQEGPLSPTAGHDINYLAVSGALHVIGETGQRPVPPANLLADFAGGGLLLAFGILAALHERSHSGRGQVVDAAMVDGASLFTTMLHGLMHMGAWIDERGQNVVDGGAPYYGTYETADGGFVAVGAVEPHFYAQLIEGLGLDLPVADQNERATWASTKAAIAAAFRSRTREHWTELFAGSDACVSPVLSLHEVPAHPHNRERRSFAALDGLHQPAPAPRFSRTPPGEPTAAAAPGAHGAAAVTGWGVDDAFAEAMRSGAVAPASA